MGYSERSLRRVVDKIHDGSSLILDNVLIHSRLRSNIPSNVEQTANIGSVVDEYDGSMVPQDDNSVSPNLLELDTVEYHQVEPIGITTETLETAGRSNPLFDHSDEDSTTADMDRFSLAEMCTYQLISFLDDAKAPRNCYDRLVALLKKQHKLGFSIADAIGRDTFLKSLKKKFNSPVVDSVTVGKSPVFKFPFIHMLQNLLDVVGPELHLIDPTAIRSTGLTDELWNTRWMVDTFRYGHRDFTMGSDVMLPLIIYMDKTGTDAYQRYSLEPVIFSLGNIPREKRDNRRAWRHLGFVPSNKHLDKSLPKLEFYHNCLQVILQELKAAQREHPTVRIKQPDGNVYELRARLPIVVVMGDQLSQDTLCARLKVNAGGASRIHRSCMCSYLSVDDPSLTCMSVSKHVLDQMTQLALLNDDRITNISDGSRVEVDFLKKLRQMNQRFLAKPYGTYPVRNAFHGADFGGWTEGIYEATLDDFMHSTELGVIKTLNEVVFQGLTKGECTEVEYLMQTIMGGVRSSVRSTYPRWRLSDGFSRQKLMTSTERVGTLFSLCLALQSHEIQNMISNAHARQRKKYVTFSNNNQHRTDHDRTNVHLNSGISDTDDDECSDSDASSDDCSDQTEEDSLDQEETKDNTDQHSQLEETQEKDDRFYFESHFQRNISKEQIQHALEHAMRHGFDIEQLKSFDVLQLNQFVSQAHKLFRKQKHSYPRRSIAGFFDVGADTNVPVDIIDMADCCDCIPWFLLSHLFDSPPCRGEHSDNACVRVILSGCGFVKCLKEADPLTGYTNAFK
jgi:Plavaka transposase